MLKHMDVQSLHMYDWHKDLEVYCIIPYKQIILTVILIWRFGDRVKIAKLTYAIIDPFIL